MELSQRGAQPSEGQDVAQRNVKEALKKTLQESTQNVSSLVEGLMVLWAWLKSWLSMVRNGFKVYRGLPQPDIIYLAPLVVMVVGLVMTNIMGFLNFRREGLDREARLAAVDLDSPYLAFQHISSSIRGETNPASEFQKLRLRNSIWRSLPLAMLTCALTSRMLIEVPMCQAVASMSAAVVGFWPEKRNQSLWVANLGVKPSKAEWARSYAKWEKSPNKRELMKIQQNNSKLADDMLKLERKLWTAAHCNKSTWTLTKLPKKIERMQDQVGAAGDESDEDLARSGLSNLIPFNVVLFQEFREDAIRQEDTLRSAITLYINRRNPTSWTGYFLGRTLEDTPWPEVVDLGIRWLKKGWSFTQMGTLESFRPWNVELPYFKVILISYGEWEMPLATALLLLVNSILPVRKQILASLGEVSTTCKLLVTLYVCLDMTLLLCTWLLCAVAPLALRFGTLVTESINSIQSMLADLIMDEAQNQADSKLLRLSLNAASKLEPELEHLAPAIAWDQWFFLQLSLGSLAFLAASAALAYAVSPDLRLSTCATFGVCGPLWIFTQETTCRDSKASKLVLYRALLLSLLVACSWVRVPKLGMELFTALTIKWRLDPGTCLGLWLCLFIPTCFFGFTSAGSLASEEEDSDDEESNSKDEESSQSSASKSNYGTFSSSSESIP
eukprot:Skav209284  [mRNA]  locus=scaffold251:9049:11058:+ [translate_table: standard]